MLDNKWRSDLSFSPVAKSKMTQIFLAIASILADLAVAAGAFASHALKEKLTERAIEIFETAAPYQMYYDQFYFIQLDSQSN
jgi:Protein of unknown function (DUF423)